MDLYGRDRVKRRKKDDDGQGANISASSFLDLKAQLAGRRGDEQAQARTRPSQDDADAHDEYSRQRLPAHLRHAGPSSSSSSSRPPKQSKATKDSATSATTTLSTWAGTPSARLERERQANLARKSKLYDELRRGLSGGLKPEDLEEGGKLQGLLDWHRILDEQDEGGRDEEDEHHETAQDEAHVEYEDELGRTRLVPASQVPMEYLVEMRRRKEEGDANTQATTLYGPQAQFPIMTRGDVRKDDEGKDTHFDATQEVRNRGAGFFRFDQQNQRRREQMEALRVEREETMRRRGQRADEGEGASQSKAEERLEARRKLVALKTEELRPKGGQDKAAASAVDHFLDTLGAQWAQAAAAKADQTPS